MGAIINRQEKVDLFMNIKLVSVVIPLRKQGLNWQAWVQLRHEDGPLDGYFEFPGGKIEPGENSQIAGARELLEEVEIKIKPEQLRMFQIVNHDYEHVRVCLYFHLLVADENQSGWQRGQWHDVATMPTEKLLAANIPVVEKLKDYLVSEPELGEWV